MANCPALRTQDNVFTLPLPKGKTEAVYFDEGRDKDRAHGLALRILGPGRPSRKEVPVPAGVKLTDLRAALISAEGGELIAYQPVERPAVKELPAPVKAPPLPAEIKTTEELYLTGLRIEQINNPNVDPEDYYREALKRDPGDVRCNTILGVHANKRGMYDVAEQFLRRAIERLSIDYTRSKDTEAYYELGLSLRGQGKQDEAAEAFHRASWDQAFTAAACYQLAELACLKRDYAKALEHVDRSLSANAANNKARNLKAMILRKLGQPAEGKRLVEDVLSNDPLDFEAFNELLMCHPVSSGIIRRDDQSLLEMATDYMNCGAWDEAIGVLIGIVNGDNLPHPLMPYYVGYLHEKKGDAEAARKFYAQAVKMPSDYCFPYRLETIDVLNAAIRVNSADARAWYYLGTLLYELQPDRAIACWEKSRAIDKGFALTHRNLGWACWHTRRDAAQAIDCYETAVACNPKDPRLLFELDLMYEYGNADPTKRLASLERHRDVVRQYQDSLLREIIVLTLVGDCDQACDALTKHWFHAREGGKIIHQVYLDAHLLRGVQRFKARRHGEALDDFRQMGELPENLALGEQAGAIRSTQTAYYTGLTHAAMGNQTKATECFEKAAKPVPATWTDARYCQAMALIKLGKTAEAGKLFDELTAKGKSLLAAQDETVDYFSKFGEKQRDNVRLAAGHHAIGLSLLGKGDQAGARREFEQALKLDASSLWTRFQLNELRR